jgi:hypothetical protein
MDRGASTDPIPELESPDRVHLALETNGRGWLGYLEELPGAFVRGQTQPDCHAKVNGEIREYLEWLGCLPADEPLVSVSKIIQSDLCVEDADNCILIDSDRSELRPEQFRVWPEIALHSALCFQRLYESAPHKTWRDPDQIHIPVKVSCLDKRHPGSRQSSPGLLPAMFETRPHPHRQHLR